MNYLSWDEKTITDLSDNYVSDMYGRGYVFTRIGKGVMQQTRSARIDLRKFQLSSENRRILKKTDGLALADKKLPLADYDWNIGKLAKDFYATKFGPNVMSAQKVKELLTDADKSNFNSILEFNYRPIGSAGGSDLPTFESGANKTKGDTLPPRGAGYVICYSNSSLIHYSYPFYNLETSPKDMGMGMMLRAILHAQEQKLHYIYLGSLQRPGDTYKLQFEGLEWFDGQKWQADNEELKALIAEESPK